MATATSILAYAASACAGTGITRKPSPPFSVSFPLKSPPKTILHRRVVLSAAASIPYSDPFSDKDLEDCDIFAVIGDPSAADLAKLSLHSLVHGDQEGAAIVTSDRTTLHRAAGLGPVLEVFGNPSLPPLPGSAAIGYNSYATDGRSASIAKVQPFLASCPCSGPLALAYFGELLNYQSLRARLEDQGSIFSTSSDAEVIQHLIATSTTEPLIARIEETCEALEGPYSLVFLTRNMLIAVRSPMGLRPLAMGRMRSTGAIVFATDTCALDLVKAEDVRAVYRGEVVVIDGDTMEETTHLIAMKKRRKSILFQLFYYSLPNSVVYGIPVSVSRYNLGRALARESPVPGADIVITVPDSGFFAAKGFSSLSGIPFMEELLPSQEARDIGPAKEILKGKSVVVIDDDSIVRGTTSKQIIQLIRNEGGAREVHMRISNPPILNSDGIDTPLCEKIDVEGMRREIGCDSLEFVSLDCFKELGGYTF